MKKYFILFLGLLIFAGCESKFDNVVSDNVTPFQVRQLSNFTAFSITPVDSNIFISISFSNSVDILKVWADVYSSQQKKINNSQLVLSDDGSSASGDVTAGDNTFSNRFTLSQNLPNGDYRIEYFVTDKNLLTRKVGSQQFLFDNSKSNIAPIISNLIAPDSLTVRDSNIVFTMSLQVLDSNGLADVETVWFISTRPDGTSSGQRFSLYDNGNLNDNGDRTANDGIFSTKVSLAPTNQKGRYRFDFQSRDFGKKLSNIIQHFVVVK